MYLSLGTHNIYSVVGGATRYLLDNLVFEFQWGATILVLV